MNNKGILYLFPGYPLTLSQLSVIIPILNESENLPRLTKQLALLSDDFEFIFVDDGSIDGSRDLIRNLAKIDHRFIGIFNDRRVGHMGSYLAGIERSSYDNLAIMDGDLQHPPEKLISISNMLSEGNDIVVCSRYDGRKFIGDRDKIRGIISRVAELLLKLLVRDCASISDPLSGFIGFHKSLTTPIRPEMKGNKLLPFLVVANPDAKIGIVNYQFTERRLGQSKIVGSGSSFILNYVREILQINEVSRFYSQRR